MDRSKWLLLLLDLLLLAGLAWLKNVPCKAEIWTSPKIVDQGPVEIFCRCKSYEVLPQDLRMQKRIGFFEIQTLGTLPVDNYTVSNREKRSQDIDDFSYECLWKNFVVGSLNSEAKHRHIYDFQCRKIGATNQANCTFAHAGHQDYKLSVDSQPQVRCWRWPIDESRVHCELITLPKDRAIYQFYLSMGFGEKVLRQKFTVYEQEMRMPPWEGQWFETRNGQICIFVNGKENPENWRIRFLPQSPKLQEYLVEVHGKFNFSEGECLKSPHHPHQHYRVLLSRSYLYGESPWSRELELGSFVTPATLPPCPQLLPHGYFYDVGRRDLYVFWQPVEEMGPDFTYIAESLTGKRALHVDHHSAVFRNWDASLQATVIVRSWNSVGFSTNSSRLDIPVLANAGRDRPQSLKRSITNNLISWQPPKNEIRTVNYTVYWCSAPENESQICDGEEPIHFRVLDGSQKQFRLPRPMCLSNYAVATNYGGMTWSGPSFPNFKVEGGISGEDIINYGLGLGFHILLGWLLYLLLRKLRHMSRIEVILPEGLLNPTQTTDFRINPITVPGSISPEAILDIAGLKNPCPYLRKDPKRKVKFSDPIYTNQMGPIYTAIYTSSWK